MAQQVSVPLLSLTDLAYLVLLELYTLAGTGVLSLSENLNVHGN